MIVKRMKLRDTNCYFISSNEAAVVIDPGYDSDEVLSFLKENQHKKRIILLTHRHFDHIGGANMLRVQTGTKIAIGDKDADALLSRSETLSERFNADVAPFFADMRLLPNEKIQIGDLNFTVMDTPGHTVGSVCYYIENHLFCGDTLFADASAILTFPTGSKADYLKTIGKLKKFDMNTVVYPGHGETTTLGKAIGLFECGVKVRT